MLKKVFKDLSSEKTWKPKENLKLEINKIQ